MPLVKEEIDAPAERKEPRRMDKTLQLCARLDRAFEQLPDWGRSIVLAYLKGKWEQR